MEERQRCFETLALSFCAPRRIHFDSSKPRGRFVSPAGFFVSLINGRRVFALSAPVRIPKKQVVRAPLGFPDSRGIPLFFVPWLHRLQRSTHSGFAQVSPHPSSQGHA